MARHVITISSDTTLSAAHSGCDVLVTGGQFTITLPAPIADCDIRVVNGDVLSGKKLVGFPDPIKTKLYPGQACAVDSDGTAWFAEEAPGRWRKQNAQFFVSSAAGASDDNDGLTLATPLRTMNYAGHMVQTDVDTYQTAPIISPVGGSTFTNDQLALGGQPTGGNLIQLSPVGTGNINWTCQGPCVTVGDNAELNSALAALSNTAKLIMMGNTLNLPETGTWVYHNNGLGDHSGRDASGNSLLRIIGAGTNCSAFFFDGPTAGAAMSDGFEVENTFGYIWRQDEGGGRFTLSGDIKPTAVTIAQGLFAILGGQELILGGPTLSNTYYAIGQSIIDDSLLVSNGIAIPGGCRPIGSGRVATSKTT